MSIVMCDDCEKRIDLDYNESNDVLNDGTIWMCDYCYGEFKQGEPNE